MSEENPYAPPDADVEVTEVGELAGLGRRLGGAIIDGLILIILFTPALYFLGYTQSVVAGAQPLAQTVFYALGGFALFLLINGYLLASSGQTVAKRLLKMRIVAVKDNRILPFGKLIGLRYLPFWVANQVPFIGVFLWLIDTLFIFRKDRRCVHDLVAGTKVVMVAD